MTNSSNIAEVLRMAHCAKLHKHVPLEGGKAKACEVYLDKFVEPECEGVRKGLEAVNLKNRMSGKFDIGECIEKLMKFEDNNRVVELTPPHEPEGDARFASFYLGCEFYDDVSGEQLHHGLAIQVRKVEIDFLQNYLFIQKGEENS